MVNIIKEEILVEESLKNKLEFICDFCKVKYTNINGNVRKIDKTNLTYIEPHRIIINNTTFLAFNYSNDISIENLSNKIRVLTENNETLNLKIKSLNNIIKETDK